MFSNKWCYDKGGVGTTAGDNSNAGEESQRENRRNYTRIIELYYSELLKLGCLYNDLYEMTIKELDDTLKYRKEGLGYFMWRMGTIEATAIGCSFSKNNKYPKKPQEMIEELFPQPKTIPMPDFLKNKYYKQKGVNYE